MIFVANSQALHGQYSSIDEASQAISSLLKIRVEVKKYDYDVKCCREMLDRLVVGELPLRAIVGQLELDTRRVLLQWITKSGQYWQDMQVHSSEEYFESKEQVVTDSAVAEVAFRTHLGDTCFLVSMTPSGWDGDDITVDWHKDSDDIVAVCIKNVVNLAKAKAALEQAPVSLNSWQDLAKRARTQFPLLRFSDDAFDSLLHLPFVASAAERMLDRLSIIETLAESFNSDGERTELGHRIYQEYFTSDNGYFSDSSDTEKNQFKNELTFKHPDDPSQKILCPWHGKVRTCQLRVHFTWPIKYKSPVYVVYVGPKITKK